LTGDEPQYVIDAYNIIFNHSRDMTEIFKNKEIIDLIYPSGGLAPHLFGSMQVTFHGVGTSLFAIPAVFFPDPVIAVKFIFNFYTATSIALLLRFASKQGTKNIFSLVGIALVFFAFPPFAYFSDQVYPEIPAILILSIVFNLFLSNYKYNAVIVSGLLSFLPWLHIRYSALTLFGFLYIFFRKQFDWKDKLTSTLLFFVSGSAYLIANNAWYQTFNPFFLSKYTYQSFLPYSDVDLLYRFGFGHLFSGTYGLFPWNPFLMLFIVFALMRRDLRKFSLESKMIISGSTLYVITVGLGGSSGGLSFPARYVIVLVPIIWVSLKFREFDKFFVKKSMINFIIIGGIGLSVVGSMKVDSLYGRGESQNTPLLSPYRELSGIWPDYSLQFGRDSQGVTGNSSVDLQLTSVEDGQMKFEIGFVPKGTHLLSFDQPIPDGSILNVTFDGLANSLQPKLMQVDGGYLLTTPYTVYLRGVVEAETASPNRANLTALENRTGEFPDLLRTLILLILPTLYLMFIRKRNKTE
jgi:hypothetical protein